MLEGIREGKLVGIGFVDGAFVGEDEGALLGATDGVVLGEAVGPTEGYLVGTRTLSGDCVGSVVGSNR